MCDRCDGKGLIKRYLDSRKAQTPIRCVFCKGQGKLKYFVECRTCKGVGIKHHTMTIRVPKGIHGGHALQVKDRGYLKPDNTKGKLFIKINITDHPVFKREGDNLRMTAKISLKEAIMGFTDKKLCTHMDGRKVLVTQTCGYTIRPNSQRRLKGEGMPVYGSKANAFGDLIITFEVEWQDSIQIPPSQAAKDVIDDLFQTNEEKKSKEDVIVIDDDEEEEKKQEKSNKNTRKTSQPEAAASSMEGNNVLEEMSDEEEDELEVAITSFIWIKSTNIRCRMMIAQIMNGMEEVVLIMKNTILIVMMVRTFI